MHNPVKVYNKGTRPIVHKRSMKGVEAIHPRKFLLMGTDEAEAIIKKFGNACSEVDYKKFLDEEEKTRREAREKSEAEAKKKK